jgi:hypothetical protein
MRSKSAMVAALLASALTCGIASGCGRLGFEETDGGRDAGDGEAAGHVDASSLDASSLDGAAVDSAASDAGPRDISLGPFGHAIPFPGARLNGDDPTLTGDMLELVFESFEGGGEDLWVSTRPSTGDGWSPPTPSTSSTRPHGRARPR